MKFGDEGIADRWPRTPNILAQAKRLLQVKRKARQLDLFQVPDALRLSTTGSLAASCYAHRRYNAR